MTLHVKEEIYNDLILKSWPEKNLAENVFVFGCFKMKYFTNFCNLEKLLVCSGTIRKCFV